MQRTLPLCRGAALAVALCAASGADAALYDRGNGMIYDSAQNITWLQDANYAQTSGFDATGAMTWDQAQAWVAQLNYGGYGDWRLPSGRLIGSSGFSYDGSTDNGYNNTRGEIGHLFAELGNNPACNTSGVCGQPDAGFLHVQFTDPDSQLPVAFANVLPASYWLGEEWKMDPVYAWRFNNSVGAQNTEFVFNEFYAWAVRDGDVSDVPIPAAAWLFGSALLGLAGVRRTRR